MTLGRRAFLRTAGLGAGAVAVGGGLSSFLAACGGDDKGGSAATTAPADKGATTAAASGASSTSAGAATTGPAKDLGTLDYRLSWIKNSEFAGSYLADNLGYYKAVGFSTVNLIAGGPSATPVEVDVQGGKALVGISAPDIVSAAIAQGAKLKIIGAQYQKNPFAVMSLASKPVKTPQEMYGKSFGLQSTNQSVWDAFVKASGLDDSKIKKIPAQFDPQPLVNGEVDTWFSFITNEPNLLKAKNVDTFAFLLADFGYPLVSEVFVVTQDSITKERDTLKAFLKAEIQGWRALKKDPQKGADLTTGTYGKDNGLDTAEQLLEVNSELELIFTADTTANGVFTITPTLVEENIKVLTDAGSKIDAASLFDLSLLTEVYQENPDLKSPV